MSHHSVTSMRDLAFRKGRHAFQNEEDYLEALYGEEPEEPEEEPEDPEEEPEEEPEGAWTFFSDSTEIEENLTWILAGLSGDDLRRFGVAGSIGFIPAIIRANYDHELPPDLEFNNPDPNNPLDFKFHALPLPKESSLPRRVLVKDLDEKIEFVVTVDKLEKLAKDAWLTACIEDPEEEPEESFKGSKSKEEETLEQILTHATEYMLFRFRMFSRNIGNKESSSDVFNFRSIDGLISFRFTTAMDSTGKRYITIEDMVKHESFKLDYDVFKDVVDHAWRDKVYGEDWPIGTNIAEFRYERITSNSPEQRGT